ncbi:MAG: RluA family pseudouridine synthase [Oscillospiraceae bacterium]|jgi:23S rRNA pseudouridine955/2504/2580 synthase|nr:RluA family pseudouridine synthase [Oscillospiraceae bacterium]
MKEYTASANDRERRVDAFMQKAAPDLPPSLLYKAFRKKDIKVNGKPVKQDYRLQAGDTIRAYLPEDVLAPPQYQYDFMKAGRELRVLYEDERLLVAYKPSGLLSHPDGTEYADTLLSRLQRYLYEKGEYHPQAENAFAPALCHRIDRNTEGIVLCAKTAEALRETAAAIKARQVRKFYLCAVYADRSESQLLMDWNCLTADDWQTVTHYLLKDEKSSEVCVYDNPKPGAKEAVTSYRVLARRSDGIALLMVELHTGRTHQIRAQLSAIGLPLVGDGKYAPRAVYQESRRLGYKNQCLCAFRLVWGELDIQIPPHEIAFVRELFPKNEKHP